MSEKGLKEVATKMAPVLAIATLAAATGCSVNTVDAHVPTEAPEPTIEPFPSPSPEFVLAIEKDAQDAIDIQFEGLGIHDTRLIGDILTDASGQNRFALFESQLPKKQTPTEPPLTPEPSPTPQNLKFWMIAGVGQENKVEWVRGLVGSEAYPEKDNVLTFASATFEPQTQIFEIVDPYLRTNLQTGEIEITNDGMVWIPLLASPYTYNEVRAAIGKGGLMAAQALPTPTTEPTPEPTPTPTEIPMYEGPLRDITREVYTLGLKPELYDPGLQEDWQIDIYTVQLSTRMTLVRTAVIPGTQIVELVWGFRLKGEDYRFKILTAPFYWDIGSGEMNMDKLPLGDGDYLLGFKGFDAPFEGTVFDEKILSLDSNSDFRVIVENLRNDPQDKTRLMNFFSRGNTEGFELDENGIIDLTKVIWLSSSGPID